MNIKDVEKIMIRVSSRDLIHFLDSNKAPQFIIVIIMVDTYGFLQKSEYVLVE